MNKSMKHYLILLGILAAPVVGSAQWLKGSNATSIQGKRIKSPLTCSDTFVITWVAANGRFECLAPQGGGSSNAATPPVGGITWAGINPTFPGNVSVTGNGTIGSRSLSSTRDTLLSTWGTVVYQKSQWSNLSDFTVVGTTPAIVNGAVEFSASLTNFDTSVLELPQAGADDNYDFEVVVKIVSTTGANGLFLGRKSQGGAAPVSLACQYTNSQINLWPQASGAITTAFQTWSSGTLALTAGHFVRYVFSQRGNLFIASEEDLTSFAKVTFTYVDQNLTKSPNVAKFRIGSLGGTYDLKMVRLVTWQPFGSIAVVGDSKTAGVDNETIDLRYASLLQQASPVAVFAGNGDTTTTALAGVGYVTALNPRYVVLNIGRNDIAGSVASATWQANYAAIVSALKAAGATVIHLLPLPEVTLADQSALTTYINSTYASDTRVDVSGTWVNGTDVSSDNIHPNANGHVLIANAILATGALPVSGMVAGPRMMILPGSSGTTGAAFDPNWR